MSDRASGAAGEVGVVLIHGANHTGACWEPTIGAMVGSRPSVRALAVDLPGRRGEPGDLRTLTLDQCVESVVEQVERAGFHQSYLVAHSLGGLVQPGVIERLGTDRVVGALYVAACIPPEGGSASSTLSQPVRGVVAVATRLSKGVADPVPRPVARWMFTNGMEQQMRDRALRELVSEGTGLSNEAVDRRALPRVPTTYVVTARDHALRPAAQHQFIHNLGHVDRVVTMDTCHNAMQSEPAQLARVVLEGCDLAVDAV